MPKYRELIPSALGLARLVRIREPDEMRPEPIDDLVRQRVFLVEQDTDEERVGTGIVHRGEAEERRGGMQDGDVYACEDGAYDRGFFQGTATLMVIKNDEKTQKIDVRIGRSDVLTVDR